MLSIQEVGKQILTGQPAPFYVMIGSEYGIKAKYIQILKDKYGEQIESESVSDILNMMRTKRLIPLKPAVYVVRYDESFLSSLGDATQKDIQSTNIIGTIVCLYEQPKHATKVEKYLPDMTVSVDAVSPQFLAKYLKSDFPNMADRFIHIAVASATNYNHAKGMCRSMQAVPIEMLNQMSDSEIAKLFGCFDTSSESQIRKGVASRNFAYLMSLLDNFEGELDSILYAILSTMIELDKLIHNRYTQSDLRDYVKRWTREDIYYMFMNTYAELKQLRSSASSDAINSVIYLIGLLQFQRIPSPEDMK